MEFGLAVGGAFISSALNVLEMFQKNTNDVHLLKKLRTTLLCFQAVLSDAENTQASDQFVSQWLNELVDAVDTAENLMEQVNYEALRLKVEGQHQNLAETSNQQVSDDFFLNIKDKLEDTIKTLKDLQEQIRFLGLKEHLVRQNDIEDLIGKNLAKTTLVNVVYNDEKVKDHFDLKAWYYVSEAYDAFRITKGILHEIVSFDSKDVDNLKQLELKLKEGLLGRKFLVVLDDVRNVNYNEWDDLKNVFVQGDMGSKIIVTSRKESVAQMMGHWAITVGTLSSDDSWALFERYSLKNRDPKEYPEFEKVGRKIVDKCKGLPLALKTLACMLRHKSEVNEWKNILRSEIWDQCCLHGIEPALKLVYNDLPAHLKHCFAYCAIYPKGYQFCKDQVIHLWIANGLVQQFHSGNEYFLELRLRSLFEKVPESEWKPEGFLMHDLINDLARNASSNLCIRLEENRGSHMLENCRHMSYSMGEGGDFEKLKSLFKSEKMKSFLPINIQLRDQIKLSKRVLHNLLPSLTSLRALSLSCYEIVELPNDLFIKLKFLRFLDISWTKIKRLPDSICVLYNLETFLLSSCDDLEDLPLQMEKLINLRHLNICNTCLLKMPLHLSKLKSLDVLVGAKFLLSGCGGLRMEDLGELHNLYGSLSILELQNVVDRREALKAKMREKNHVEKLSLEWSGSSVAHNSQTERDILDELCPHTNIKEVEITGYRGTKFPNWLADPLFYKLEKLSLCYCKDCDSLPALGQLRSLKFLSIREMHGITEVTEEFFGSWSFKKPFNSLEKLEFEDMPEWKQWHVLGNGEFPALEKLSIQNCPKLIGKLPENLSSLTELIISRCPVLNLETPIKLSNLQIFDVDDSPVFDDSELFGSQLEGMKQIKGLYIGDCNSLTSFPFSILPNTLKEIGIFRCQKLKLEAPVGDMISSSSCNMFLEKLTLCGFDTFIDDISPELVPRARKLDVFSSQNLTKFFIPTATDSLSIWNCKNLEKLSGACGGTQMTHLRIIRCSKLKWLPEHMPELLPSLKELHLSYCPEIEFFPEGGLPFNLQKLEIRNCKKLVNGRKEWRLQRLSCLRELWINHDGSDEEILAGKNWELPSSIQRLEVSNMKTLSSQLLKSLSSLEYLCIADIPQIQSMVEEGLPSSLSQLHLNDQHQLHSLPTEGFRYLTSLQSLVISSCHQLQSLSLPSSLSQLIIDDCPNLKSVKGMPSPLSKLSISNCPFLKSLLKFDEGEYWPEIAHISTIEIDEECL
ncbi:putative disease resistance RPP13-like protein 1 [Solanum stenotomum]|uniref:putative disease resistance RPP13-like protein 1 n=1 Tax=Solanum stenotomum TaxID=172797 RepID=UPI0020D17A9C|nr:putative disease resistance RPP13-like protein 1 [Solanum stenotomum]